MLLFLHIKRQSNQTMQKQLMLEVWLMTNSMVASFPRFCPGGKAGDSVCKGLDRQHELETLEYLPKEA